MCVEGWAKFTPYAIPADVDRLMRLDLSCLTRWRTCRIRVDIMPAAWAQHLSESPLMDGLRSQMACIPPIIEMLGRDSANVAIGEILDYRESVDGQGSRHGLTRVRVLGRLKGSADWNVGNTREVPIQSEADREEAKPSHGSQLIFFGGWGHSNEMWLDPGYGCRAVLANETNLSLVGRGIDQDYSAMDKTD